MLVKQRSIYLKNKFNFNCLPISYFSRDKNGNKIVKFYYQWQRYKTLNKETGNLYQPPSSYYENAQALAIITGKYSNLVVIDIDTQEALNDIENYMGCKIKDFCKYIIKTQKGWQLFFKYVFLQNIKNIKNVDILTNEKLCFGDIASLGYSIICDDELVDMPLKLIDYITTKDNNQFNFKESKLNVNYYKQPLTLLFTRWKENKNFLSESLKNELSNRLLQKIPFKEANKEGNRHNLAMHVMGLAASDPTVSEEQFLTDCLDFVKEVISPDDDINQYVIYNQKFITYDNNWKDKYNNETNFVEKLKNIGWVTFYNPHIDKYILISQQDMVEYKFLQNSYKKFVTMLLQDSKLKIDILQVPYFKNFIFSPYLPSGENIINNLNVYNYYIEPFYIKKYLEYREDIENGNLKKETKLPDFIGTVIRNVFPIKEHRDLFLHNLAYHLYTKEVCQNAIISLGKIQATGKGVLFDKILPFIYDSVYINDNSTLSLIRENGIIYTTKITPQVINSNFNGSLYKKLYAHYNEVVENHNKSNTQSLVNKFKNIIAEEKITIIQKGKDEITCPNHLFVVMSSNDVEPFKIDTTDNRRFNFFPTSNKKLKDIYQDLNNSNFNLYQKIKSEINQFLHYLASIELSFLEYQRIIETDLYLQIKDNSITVAEKIANAIINKDLHTLEEEAPPMFYEKFKLIVIDLNIAYISVKEFKELCGVLYLNIRKKLIHSGIKIETKYLPLYKKVTRGIFWNPSGNYEAVVNF